MPEVGINKNTSGVEAWMVSGGKVMQEAETMLERVGGVAVDICPRIVQHLIA